MDQLAFNVTGNEAFNFSCAVPESNCCVEACSEGTMDETEAISYAMQEEQEANLEVSIFCQYFLSNL